MTDKLPQINLELNSGAFRIRTSEAVYNIMVKPDSSISRVVEQIVEKGVGDAEEPAIDWERVPGVVAPEVDIFYREFSEDMYREIGNMARQLSISLQGVTVESLEAVDLESTGRRLEAAKGQLQDLVDMTEKATMDIIDLTEAIQHDVTAVTKQLDKLEGIDLESAPFELIQSMEAVANSYVHLYPAAGELVALVEALPPPQVVTVPEPGAAPQAPPPPEPEPAPTPEPRTKTVTRQGLDVPWEVLFQTLYEFCTNEVVKKHIKNMWNSQAAFNAEAVQAGIQELAKGLTPDEDNFIMLPLNKIFQALFKTTANEDFRSLLKKMNSTIDKIFLEPSLTLEPVTVEITEEVPAEPAEAPPPPPPPPSPEPETAARIEPVVTEGEWPEELIKGLEAARTALTEGIDPARSADIVAGLAGAGILSPELKHGLESGASDVSETVTRINSHVNAILEALSFQDLSGQQIKRIVALITDFQVQLLALVVSFGSKLKAREEESKLTLDETAKLAQQDIDAMMSRIEVSAQEGEMTSPLDQGAVDSLLGDLGF